jgi:hypothetical protein
MPEIHFSQEVQVVHARVGNFIPKYKLRTQVESSCPDAIIL